MDAGLLLLRLILGGVLFAHATQKTFGWFAGPGLTGATAIFEKLGQRPARLMVIVASVCESTAAALLLLGLLTPLGAAVATGTMLVAGGSLNRLAGMFWNAAGGGEYPWVLAGSAGVLAFTGPGAVSIDHVIDAPWYAVSASESLTIGLIALAVAGLAAVPPLYRAVKSSPRSQSDATTAVPDAWLSSDFDSTQPTTLTTTQQPTKGVDP